jgi:hypothetical protein
MEHPLQAWLESAGASSGFYQLLGKPRFHLDRGNLLLAMCEMNRELASYGQRAEGVIVERARQLQLQLGEAHQIFTRDQEWATSTERPAARCGNSWRRWRRKVAAQASESALI